MIALVISSGIVPVRPSVSLNKLIGGVKMEPESKPCQKIAVSCHLCALCVIVIKIKTAVVFMCGKI